MFLENNKHKGWIEVICGSMFSGKTEELIRRMKRAQFANLKVEIFKPSIDVRYSEEDVVSGSLQETRQQAAYTHDFFRTQQVRHICQCYMCRTQSNGETVACKTHGKILDSQTVREKLG